MAATASPTSDTETVDSSQTGYAWRVTLLNCDCHSFDEVEKQLIQALRCSIAQARSFSWEVHSQGAAVVYEGPRERCEAVAAVLEDIRLTVKVCR